MGREMAATEDRRFTTISGIEIEPLYDAADVEVDYERDLGAPGAFPFTRGVYPTMYRGRLWTMRQFAGFGTRRGDERALPLPARRTGRRGSRPRSTCRR